MRVFTARSNIGGRFSQRKLYFEGKYAVEVTVDDSAVEITCENDEGNGKEVIVTFTREEAAQVRLALNAKVK
jgi:hypothetical protein